MSSDTNYIIIILSNYQLHYNDHCELQLCYNNHYVLQLYYNNHCELQLHQKSLWIIITVACNVINHQQPAAHLLHIAVNCKAAIATVSYKKDVIMYVT